MDVDRRNMIRNLAAGFFSGASLTSFASLSCLVAVWVRSAPRSPDPSQGLVFPHNDHGSIGYFSAFQATSFIILLASFVLFFGLALAIEPLRKITGTRVSWAEDDPRRVGRWGLFLGVVTGLAGIFLPGPWIVREVIAAGTSLHLAF